MRDKGTDYRLSVQVKDAIKALNHETRMKIIEYLMNNEILYYSEIRNQMNLSENFDELESHLMILSGSGLIDRYTSTLDETSVEKSFYKLSPFAIKLINGLGSSMEPFEYTYDIDYVTPQLNEWATTSTESVRTYNITRIKSPSYKWKEKSNQIAVISRKSEKQIMPTMLM